MIQYLEGLISFGRRCRFRRVLLILIVDVRWLWGLHGFTEDSRYGLRQVVIRLLHHVQKGLNFVLLAGSKILVKIDEDSETYESVLFVLYGQEMDHQLGQSRSR